MVPAVWVSIQADEFGLYRWVEPDAMPRSAIQNGMPEMKKAK
ncbi:hypothetical protein SFMTTN_3504 [Sulfuriferula multivorans]|uniref:Uncharacterized protein n=1 Tax=Sulfuriferula multivorans TaxID=1559896 RepID=A0A401JHV8_9PROT|nr:hypothetical protein SFMTTN_3504 [Sulfuriferula multivorans]